MDKRTSTHDVLLVLLLWYLLLATTTFTQYCHANPNGLCLKNEREALLTFKQGIIDPLNRLSSWTGEECCLWSGIGCDNVTGHVIKLNLQYRPNFSTAPESPPAALEGPINDSLLVLENLFHLDLSSNSFGGNRIPSFFGYFRNLRYLDLSYADFEGAIPSQLGNLSNLQYLDLQGYFLNSDDLEWLSRLSLLEFLNMSWVDLSKASNWLQAMNMLPSLSVLRLSSCKLDDYQPISYVNFSSLVELELSFNNFVNTTFDWLHSLTSLVTLDLMSNHIQGVLPNARTGSLPQLMEVDLSNNVLEGELPKFLGNLCNLRYLDLSHNRFEGGVYGILGNSSACDMESLEYLNLAGNQLSGTLPDQPCKCQNLSTLLLNSNLLSGPIPVSIRNLSVLEELDVSNNFLAGSVFDMHFSNLTRLERFIACSNSLTLQVSSDWIPPFQLQVLEMESWQIGPRFPAWLQSQKGLRVLNLSNSGISYVIPSWFCNHFSQISLLDLSHNQIRGTIPSLSCSVAASVDSNLSSSPPLFSDPSTFLLLDLSNNSFHGFLSSILCEHKASIRSLIFLDLSRNLLSGEFPNCWSSYADLQVLHLGNNNLSGNLPSSLGYLSDLQSLVLHRNNLVGNLPLSLQDCKLLKHVDLSENHFSGALPSWLGNSLEKLKILVLHSNNFNHSIPHELCRLNSLQILDLADNDLSGFIPRCLSNFSAMVRQLEGSSRIFEDFYTLGQPWFLETTAVKEKITDQYSNTLALITSMNLSRNNLVGEIPQELTSLYSLQFLNLSNNQLVGKIPETISAMKLLESLDISMNQLTNVSAGYGLTGLKSALPLFLTQ
ncbi:receptor-like protein EIX2 [Juglans microcarpa x Juglans regia]|uniref:receptor-like protein EIX2 n=1 Tax=Juglans microcarpa x Juglans regia TaxID=2249226 RepID=UPI001B7E13DA|nr:receptor-like protein EIX2 [Juglans microcarpa x Juglans regia]